MPVFISSWGDFGKFAIINLFSNPLKKKNKHSTNEISLFYEVEYYKSEVDTFINKLTSVSDHDTFFFVAVVVVACVGQTGLTRLAFSCF